MYLPTYLPTLPYLEVPTYLPYCTLQTSLKAHTQPVRTSKVNHSNHPNHWSTTITNLPTYLTQSTYIPSSTAHSFSYKPAQHQTSFSPWQGGGGGGGGTTLINLHGNLHGKFQNRLGGFLGREGERGETQATAVLETSPTHIQFFLERPQTCAAAD